MKRNFEHLNKSANTSYDYTEVLFEKTTSKVFQNNLLLKLYMKYMQAIIMSGARRIKYITNYQNVLKNKHE